MPSPTHRKTEAANELRSGNYCLPLVAMDVQGEVHGLLYSAAVTQTYLNETRDVLEATYIFPLPPKAAVHGFVLRVGSRLIRGTIQERAAARAHYEEAKRAGHRAALLEEERSDIFTLTVGNIAPTEEVSIQFEFSGFLESFGNRLRLRIPLVVGEVYVPGTPLLKSPVGRGVSPDTDQVSDASRITPPRLAPGAANPVNLSLRFEVNPGCLQFDSIGSSCHFAQIKPQGKGFSVALIPGLERLKRAFVLEASLKPDTLQTNLLVDYANKVFALTVVPPASSECPSLRRDVVILLDRSGSMSGWNIVAAKRAVQQIIEGLNEADRFSLILFNQRTLHLDMEQALFPADEFHKQMAGDFLDPQTADGGTEMLAALQQAYEKLPDISGRPRHIILITDGEIGNDRAVLEACKDGVRVTTVGIGHAARDGVLREIAEKTRGLCVLIPSESQMESDLLQLHRSWGSPYLQSLSLTGESKADRAPIAWDVWPHIACTFLGRFDQLPKRPEIAGWLADGSSYSRPVEPVATESPVVFRSWARYRLLRLQDLHFANQVDSCELVNLSVFAQVLCPFTAFVAVDGEQVVDLRVPRRSVVQAVESTQYRASNLGYAAAGGAVLASAAASARRDAQSLPVEPIVALAGEAKERLRLDLFLLTYQQRPAQAVESSLQAVEELLKWISILLLESRIPTSHLKTWKAFLSVLLDYHRALESMQEGADPREAVALRRELSRLVEGLL